MLCNASLYISVSTVGPVAHIHNIFESTTPY